MQVLRIMLRGLKRLDLVNCTSLRRLPVPSAEVAATKACLY